MLNDEKKSIFFTALNCSKYNAEYFYKGSKSTFNEVLMRTEEKLGVKYSDCDRDGNLKTFKAIQDVYDKELTVS